MTIHRKTHRDKCFALQWLVQASDLANIHTHGRNEVTLVWSSLRLTPIIKHWLLHSRPPQLFSILLREIGEGLVSLILSCMHVSDITVIGLWEACKSQLISPWKTGVSTWVISQIFQMGDWTLQPETMVGKVHSVVACQSFLPMLNSSFSTIFLPVT